jgi:uncharacterized membrane protein
MTSLRLGLEIAAALGSGIVAGIFYAFSTFVMRGLGRLPPEQGIAAMNSINVAVINPLFFAAFFGTAIVCAVLGLWSLVTFRDPGALCTLIGCALYLVGVIGVTMRFNVPLNNALAAAPQSPEGASLWSRYLTEWTNWNHVRTVAPALATLLFISALWLQARVGLT